MLNPFRMAVAEDDVSAVGAVVVNVVRVIVVGDFTRKIGVSPGE